jgi:hypothetical protein
MRNGFARCLVLAGLAAPALFACSDDKPEDTGTAGSSSGGSAAGTQSGGSATAGTNASAGTTSGGTTGTAGTGTAGTGTAGSGTAGTGTAGTATGGTGGSGGGAAGGSGGSASGGGGAGGGSGTPTAVANITGLMGQTVTGTATFTQGATMTTLVLNLTACPAGAHASHLHAMKDCGDNGNAAGGHWVPNGEGLGDYTCADNKGMLTVMKPIATWTVGDGSATDVTKYSFMVHEMGGASPGGRIGCGVINKQ